MTPQLADYDWVVLNTSSGKDSQTAMRRVMLQAERESYPKSQIVGAHADLGRMEWPGTKELAAQHAAHYDIRLWTMARPQGDLLSHVAQRGMWPSSEARYCTSDHKRGQIRKLFTELAAAHPNWFKFRRKVRILNVMGMRAQESPARAKLKPFTFDTAGSNKTRRHVDTWLPIHDLTLADVWGDIKASGVPWHPAYNLGMPRLSCIFCIFSPPAALMIAGKHNPDLLNDYVTTEKLTGHTFRKDFPIERVQQAIAKGEDWGPATDWVM
jgi:3'-phosphoadenosine 5'-phosphosulfate sulfotransferase (PAPS reductase)/FAD synthetase